MLKKYNIKNISKKTRDALCEKQEPLYYLAKYLLDVVPFLVREINLDLDELEIIAEKKKINSLLFFLKKHTYTQFDVLTDIVGSDYPKKDQRFEITYHLLSISFSVRVRVVIYTDEVTPIDSVTGIFSVAGWQEREVYDMFGVFFNNHPDLRRILTDYGFEGHPLRKDFPLSGFYEIYYDETEKRIIKKDVSLPQDYRNFHFNNPWEES